jgi:hypothetical protein
MRKTERMSTYKPTFIDILCTAQYALLPFISHAKALHLSCTCRAARGIVLPMLWLCHLEGKLHWISGHEASFLDGPLERAKYSDICGLAVGNDNSLYLSDSHNNVLRRLSLDAASILTSRVDGPRGLCVNGEEVYAACDKGISLVSLHQPDHCTILRHLPRLLVELPGPLAPFHVCRVGINIYVSDFSSTLYHWNGEALESMEFPNSMFAGMCSDGNALLVCDYAKGCVMRLQEGVHSIVFEYARVRCVAQHEGILYVSSDTELIELRPKKRPIVYDLDIGIKALALTRMGTPIVASFSQVFAVL